MRKMLWPLAAATALSASSVVAQEAVSCGGAAMLGGTQLNCSHVKPGAPTEFCTYSWALMGQSGPTVVEGSFMLMPGASNVTVYQGSGFDSALSNPIVLCQGRAGPDVGRKAR